MRNRNVKTLVLTILLSLIFSNCSLAESNANKIKLCAISTPPFADHSLPNHGPLIDLTTKIFSKLGYIVEPVYMPWARAFIEVNKGSCLIAGMWPSETRRKSLFFSQNPVVVQQLGYFYRKDDIPFQLESTSTVAVERSSYLPIDVRNASWTIYDVNSPMQGAKMVAKRRVDAVFAEVESLKYLLRVQPKINESLVLHLEELHKVNGYLVASKNNSTYVSLVKEFDLKLVEVISNTGDKNQWRILSLESQAALSSK